MLKPKYKETDLLKFINELIISFEKQMQIREVTLKTEFNEPDFKVFIDEKIMKQACSQIINEALKNTQKQGTISISVNISNEMPDYFNLIIENQDIALSQSEIQKINNILINDLDNNNLDTSIDFGLIFANKVIRLHNGKISLNSNADGETIITCCIPIKQFLQ